VHVPVVFLHRVQVLSNEKQYRGSLARVDQVTSISPPFCVDGEAASCKRIATKLLASKVQWWHLIINTSSFSISRCDDPGPDLYKSRVWSLIDPGLAHLCSGCSAVFRQLLL